nr:hypothetical protein BaRGS_010436 [Batillaria attramentaria]
MAYAPRGARGLSKNKELNTLAASLTRLQQSTEHTTIQWIPSHCNIHGNEEADRLAKDGSRLPQEEQELKFEEVKTIVREIQRRRRRQEHPDYNNSDGYYHLSREDQVIIVRLRTGHCRFKHHMFTKFNIGDTAACSCGAPRMAVDHLLQNCPTHQNQKGDNLTYRHAVAGEDLPSVSDGLQPLSGLLACLSGYSRKKKKKKV